MDQGPSWEADICPVSQEIGFVKILFSYLCLGLASGLFR